MLLTAVICLALAGGSSAELVTLTTGRTLSVLSYREDGATAVLALRGGGEVRCRPDLIARVDPNEVPDPPPVDGPPASESDPAETKAPFGDLIDRLAREHGVEARLVRAIVRVESDYQSHALSPRGAMGLMQLMPGTARQYQVSDPYDAAANVDAGIRHLKSLLTQFTLPHALAAYNAGEGAVRRFGGIPPFAETKAYVRRVLAMARAEGT
jgi:soluble lytic murein transglycosylase-like protein